MTDLRRAYSPEGWRCPSLAGQRRRERRLLLRCAVAVAAIALLLLWLVPPQMAAGRRWLQERWGAFTAGTQAEAERQDRGPK